MHMEFSTDTANLCLNREEGTLLLQLGPNRGISLRAEDRLHDSLWFRTAEDWQEFRAGQLYGARFRVHAEADGARTTGTYTIYAKEHCPALLFTASVDSENAAAVELPFRWLNFVVEDALGLYTLAPAWHISIPDLKNTISFRENMLVETENGIAGFFRSGEPAYFPAEHTICPDICTETEGLTGYRPLHTAVIGYCEGPAGMEALRAAAEALYDEVLAVLAPLSHTYAGTLHKICHGPLSFTVTVSRDGAALTAMKNIGPEAAFALPLTELVLRDLDTGREFAADTRSGWSRAELKLENSGGRIMLGGYGDYRELSLELVFTLLPENRVEWETHILNGQQNLSVLSASYVPSPWAADNADCFIPEHSGCVVRNALRAHYCRRGIYPRGWTFTMSYFAAYAPDRERENGFYCGVCDPFGAFRTMQAETDPIAKTGLFFARMHAPGYGKGGNAFSLSGRLVWQIFDGDWYDATLIYKDFVHTRASWLPAVGPEGREDTPLWMRELPLWIMDWLPNTNPLADPVPTSINKRDDEPADKWYMDPIRLQQEIGTPLGYHVYNWHWIPFNNDYPHYLPAKKEFQENLQKLRAHNIRVMPYINARLWDTKDKENTDWMFSARARQWATKDGEGRLFTEKYESHEPDGSLCELAIMCPSSGVWKEELAGILQALFEDLGVDGVYMDQIAAAAPYLCQDPAHNHTPGGGSWWVEQYNLMMRRNRQIRGDRGILTTEDNSEVYAKAMDGFLTWIWTTDNLVPAFPVLYAGYIAMFGRTTNGLKKGDPVFFKYETAEQFLFGGQLGWLNTDVLYRENELAFLKTIANLRYRYAAFFYKGEALRPGTLTCDRSVKLTTPAYFDTRLFEARQVLTGTWRLWDKSRTVTFLINCDDSDATFTLRQEGLGVRLEEGNGVLTEVRSHDGWLTVKGTIEANQYLVLEVTLPAGT